MILLFLLFSASETRLLPPLSPLLSNTVLTQKHGRRSPGSRLQLWMELRSHKIGMARQLHNLPPPPPPTRSVHATRAACRTPHLHPPPALISPHKLQPLPLQTGHQLGVDLVSVSVALAHRPLLPVPEPGAALPSVPPPPPQARPSAFLTVLPKCSLAW